MALNSKTIKSAGGDQPVIDPGVYPGRFVQILDLGLQAQRPYQGKEKNPVNEIMITYELVDCFMVDKDGKELTDKPRFVSETLPLYNIEKADKAKCTQRYKAADPNNIYDGDFSKLINTPVNVSLVINQKDGKTYINVANIAAMRGKDAEKCPELVNQPVVFDLDNPDLEVFSNLPDWIQEKITKNLNFNGSILQRKLNGDPEPAPVDVGDIKPDGKADDSDTPWD